MFDKFENEATASFELVLCSPFIISAKNESSINPILSDDKSLESYDISRGKYVPIIPGSSIKGAFRNAAAWEQIIKTNAKTVKDNEFISSLFGRADSIMQKSKISFNDAYAMDGYKIATRNSAAINPLVQSTVRGVLFNTDAVISGRFTSGFKIVNFSCEEIMSIFRVMQKINTGSVRFGGRTSKGCGKMKIENFTLNLTTGYDEDLYPISKFFDSFDSAYTYFAEMEET